MIHITVARSYEPNALKNATRVPLFGAITRYRDAETLRRDRRQQIGFAGIMGFYVLVFIVLILVYVIDGSRIPDTPLPTVQSSAQQVMS